MISQSIQTQIQNALKNRDEVRLTTLHMLSSALNYAKIDKMGDLNEDDELAVIRREVKKRNEAAEIYTKANELEKAKKEKDEAKILEEFLPAQMPDSDLESIVENVIKELGITDKSQMGKIIGAVVARTKGLADGKKIAGMVAQKLQ